MYRELAIKALEESDLCKGYRDYLLNELQKIEKIEKILQGNEIDRLWLIRKVIEDG